MNTMKMVHGLGIAALFLGLPLLASANISVNPQATTTPQPAFETFCTPYQTPFLSGGYYTTTDGGDCTYILPAIPGAQRDLAIYQGTPGSATLVSNDYSGNFPNSLGVYVVDTTPNNFDGSQGEPFFSVAYGADSVNGDDPFNRVLEANAYFTTGAGSPPEGLQMVQWLWGTPPPPPPPPTSPLTVTADNQTMIAGAALPVLTATLSGFVNGDTLATSDVTGQAACSTTAATTSPAGTYPITCTLGTLASAANYTFSTFVPGTLTITAPPPPPDTTPPTIVITNPTSDGIYSKTDTVLPTAIITDQSSFTATYWFGTTKINPALPLPLSTVSTPSIQSVSVSAKDSAGNTSTSTVKFFVVKSTNSCLLDIIGVLTMIIKDKTFPDKITINQLISDCSALSKGKHHY